MMEHDCKEEKSEDICKFRKYQYTENPQMEIYGEDLEIVMECDHCGPWMIDMLRQDRELDGCCGRGWVREDYTLCIIGNDVVSIFPSLDSENTGKIFRQEVARSTMNIDGFNMRLGVKYIAMNEEYTSDLEEIRALLPVRMTKPGVKPTMKSKWVNHKEILADDDWIYPPGLPTERQSRIVMGHVTEIGTRALFENFCYRFGGESYHHQAGGPIGARVTMCAARMVMQHWARGYKTILLRAGLRLPLSRG